MPLATRPSRRSRLVLLTVVVCAVGAALALWVYREFYAPCPQPPRPASVAAAATWAGGCDGGSWIELLGPPGDGRVRLRVVSEDGSVAAEDWYTFGPGCAPVDPASFSARDGTQILLTTLDAAGRACALVPAPRDR